MQDLAFGTRVKIKIRAMTVIRTTPPSTAPRMIHFVLQPESLIWKRTERVEPSEDSVFAVTFLQEDCPPVVVKGMLAREVQFCPDCLMSTLRPEGVVESSSNVIDEMFAHPLM